MIAAAAAVMRASHRAAMVAAAPAAAPTSLSRQIRDSGGGSRWGWIVS